MTTPCYYCEEDADVACRACIHSNKGPEIEQVIAWRTTPPDHREAMRLLRRIRAWDMLDTAADGAFWKREIDALTKALGDDK
jgi:hypothetical protein